MASLVVEDRNRRFLEVVLNQRGYLIVHLLHVVPVSKRRNIDFAVDLELLRAEYFQLVNVLTYGLSSIVSEVIERPALVVNHVYLEFEQRDLYEHRFIELEWVLARLEVPKAQLLVVVDLRIHKVLHPDSHQ